MWERNDNVSDGQFLPKEALSADNGSGGRPHDVPGAALQRELPDLLLKWLQRGGKQVPSCPV